MPVAWISAGWIALLAVGAAVGAAGGGWVMFAFACFLGLWAVFLLAARLVDEDVNHWDWPSDKGPGAVTNIRMAAFSAFAAAVPVVAVWLLLER